ncbi:MAG: cobalamin biosynthesis protein CbiG, partial [Candidatus Electrothrix sp. ATG2]|nr:cobalamin biosynthesis protein CbiG [Candidatus Electrothrix sp. ATG2]
MPSPIAIIPLTKGGKHLAQRLTALVPGSEIVPHKGKMHQTLAQAWQDYNHLICIMATGIVVRSIAPLLQDKAVDPAVVVCDEQ